MVESYSCYTALLLLMGRCGSNHTLPDRPWGSRGFLYNGYRTSFLRAKWPEHGANHTLPIATGLRLSGAAPSTSVSALHDRGELYLYIYSFTVLLLTCLRHLRDSIPDHSCHGSANRWCRVLEKLIVSHLVKAFSILY